MPLDILSIDLGRAMGWARGVAGTVPVSGTFILREAGEPPGLAMGALARWIRDHKRDFGKPDLIVCEHWLPPAQQPSGAAVEDSLRMNGVVNGMAGIYGIAVVEPYPAMARAMVCGRASVPGESKRTGAMKKNVKWLAIDTMILRGYLPKGSEEDNRADSLVCWSWGEAVHGRAAPADFKLTGG